MILGIDAANILGGGGLHHLVEVLKLANPVIHSFSKIIVFGSEKTLSQFESRSWLIKVSPAALNSNLIKRIVWQRFFLSEEVRKYKCNLLFVPGGVFVGNFRPVVSMNQNLIPFEWKEIFRYGLSFTTFKLFLLRYVHAKTFTSIDGIIFLTEHARSRVSKIVNIRKIKSITISHGVNAKFSCEPKIQKPITNYSTEQPFRILYISTIDLFKHQWYVVEAIAKLRSMGYPVVLDLVGGAYPQALKRLQNALNKHDPENEFVDYLGYVPYREIEKKYKESDLFVFASSCETFGQIIIEAMSAGLPIACSERSAMSELLQNCGVYFNPEDSSSISDAICRLLDDPSLRFSLANSAKEISASFTWNCCVNKTFSFFKETLQKD